ncbi:Platelet-activating factor acetylhydrolase, isoform II [Allokutzneria albata]|uniref:Platelet-activating factor acetylhydrolase, isoform II n=2 Tax=Allokutzneria albata TaxID=211114 RepID=A0A1G9TUZ7_ALLAB|nr:Platelet-activating factor acetylhydrolase, isoform II [Allokutzneria albata]
MLIAVNRRSALLLAAALMAPSSRGVRIALPRPTGVHPIGTTTAHLVDHARRDPWHPERARELMVTLTYPARRSGHTAWLPPSVADYADTQLAAMGVALNSVDWAKSTRYACDGAPISGRFPVVLFSPGLQAPREPYSALTDDLASHGYFVVSMSHTYEAAAVEFPGGRVERGVEISGSPESMKRVIDTRVADTRFVLDQLGRFKGADLSRIGAFGHSSGEYTAGETMVWDRRIGAGINLDGAMCYSSGIDGTPYLPGEVVTRGLDRPFLLLGEQMRHPDTGVNGMHDHRPGSFDRTWVDFWPNQRGYRRDFTLHAGRHLSFSDLQVLLPQLGTRLSLAAREAAIGTVDPTRSVAAQRAYVAAFFDLHLRGRDTRLLDGPSPAFPELTFVP